jgi:hypothetical protein
MLVCSLYRLLIDAEPARPEQVYLGGENRYERGPRMEAPPVYSKGDRPPEYGMAATEAESSVVHHVQ